MTGALPSRRAEQITATVLFADVLGFSRLSAQEGPEKAYLAVTQLLRLLDAIARKHGGSVDKYQGDKLMAVFGYPVPLEDPPRAAVTAALEMRQQVADYSREAQLAIPFETHIGINTGELVGGDIRGPVVREFHVLGDAVNVAARLNSKAPAGEIWVGQRTHEATREAFHWQALEPLRFKGKSRPVPIFSLLTARGGAARDRLGFDQRLVGELVGREAPLASLRELVRALAGGRGGAALLTGPEGSGKSRLLAALGESEEIAGLRILQARASPAERAVGVEEASARSEAAQRPLLIVIEDAQWLESRSIARLERLTRLARELPILVIATARPDPVANRLAETIQINFGADGALIELPPLDREAAGALVRAALGAAADDETVALVLERGGGLPGPLLQAAFLAPALRSEREQANQRADRTTEAERRRAVVVFADITGFTAMTEREGAEAAYPVVAACLEILDEVARSHGGTVDHYLGDCVMALFGVPRALEDAPRAALNAAIDMRRRIREFREQQQLPVPIDVHIGVAMGLGIAGDISGPLIREFAVMGDHVDRADALTHAAESGEIFVDDATHRAVRDVFEFRASEARLLPGASEPQPIWNLLSTAPRLHRARLGAERKVFSELVGRELELARLGEVLAALARGEGGVASVVAEAGLGKSRLLAELRKRDGSALWLEGRSISNGRNLSYHPIADLVRSAAGVVDQDDAAAARLKLDAVVEALLPDRVDETAPLLANLMGAALTPEVRERLNAIQGDALEKMMRSAILQMLRALSAGRPVVILMEDLHWADLSSVELVESLLRLVDERPILFLNAFRPGFEDTSGRVLAFARDKLSARHVQVDLEPLGPAAARAIVKNLFRGGDVPQKTRAAIEESARGNPFYIEEVVRTLIDAGGLVFREGGFHATEKLDTVAIPDTVQEAVLARVDRLDLRRRSILQAASVIGQIFHRDVLESMVEDREGLAPLLEGLEESEFIVPADRSAGVEYAFKHPLIQEVTYDSMLEARRRELHLEVAKAAEERLSDSVAGYCAMLAYHYTKGGDAENADEYLFRAGDEAARVAASNEALHFFQEASKLYADLHGKRGDPARRALLEKNLAIALLNRGRLIEAVDHFDVSTQLLGAPAPRGALAMGARFAANLARVMGRLYLRKRPWGRRAATPRERELIDVMFRRAMAQSTSAPTRFLVDSVALLRRVSALDPFTIPESAAMYAGVVAIFSYGGISFGLGRRFLDIASELAEGGAVEERVLYYRTLRFLHHLLAGDWSDAHAIEPEAVDRGLREGRFWEASTYTNLNGVKQLYQGNFEAARGCIAKLGEITDLYQHDLAASALHAVTAYLHVERREFAPALAALELYYDEHAEATFNLLALGTRAKVSALMGDADAAEANLRRAEAVLTQAGRVAPYHQSVVRSARYLADVLALERALLERDGSVGEARRRAAKSRVAALETAERVAFRLPEALRLAGREAWLREQGAEALDWWRKAEACCQRLGTRPELGRTLSEAARALGAGLAGDLGGRDAAACRAEAIAIFEALDLRFDRTQIPDAA
jgi:class 3 adenylate cyclase